MRIVVNSIQTVLHSGDSLQAPGMWWAAATRAPQPQQPNFQKRLYFARTQVAEATCDAHATASKRLLPEIRGIQNAPIGSTS